ncbi:MAG: hypothetical protein OGMRLDGQ_001134 [Candidatus Fervidibacter sp.]
MVTMRTVRQLMAVLLVLIGGSVVGRGIHYAATHDLGWHAIITPLVIGSLVIALGIARWRYWQTR